MWLQSRRNEKLAIQRGDQLVASNEQLGNAMVSFYERALKEGALLNLSTKFRNELTSDMTRFYESMIENSNGDPAVTRTIVYRLWELADAYLNWGHQNTVLSIHHHSIPHINQLIESPLATPEDYILKAKISCQTGSAVRGVISYKASQEHFEEALRWANKACEFNNRIENRSVVMKARLGLIVAAAGLDGFEHVRAEFTELITELESLNAEHPNQLDLLDTLMETHGKHAQLCNDPTQAIESRKEKEKVINAIINVCTSKGISAALYENYKTTNRVFLAVAEAQHGNHEKATTMFRASIVGYRDAIARSPAEVQTRMDLAETLVLYANHLWDQQDMEEAMRQFDDSLSLFEGVIRQYPLSSNSIRRCTDVHEMMATKMEQVEKPEQAERFRLKAAMGFARLFDLPFQYYGKPDFQHGIRRLQEAREILVTQQATEEIDEIDKKIQYLEEKRTQFLKIMEPTPKKTDLS